MELLSFLLAILLFPPLFTLWGARGQDITLVYTIDEEAPAGTFVGDVAQDSNIRDLVGSEQEFRALRYSFLAEGSNLASNFRLQNNTGSLTTKKKLDRETLCRFQLQCRLALRLAAQSSQGLFFRIIDVTVVLRDVNDNAPTFSPSETELLILENVDVGDLFQLPSAVDADTGANNSVQTYSMLTSGVPFALQTRGRTGEEEGLWLRLTDTLDRETEPSYRLLIVAADGGQPVRSGTLVVDVKVEDVNDHAPSWAESQYTANVSEIIAVNSTVITLRAQDADSGDNALLTYRFTPLQADTTLGLFALNHTSGELTVAKPLDTYAGQTYTLEVEARDAGTPYKSSRTDVIVHVLDTHNSKPEIILSVFGQGNMAVLSEFSEPGRVVAHIAIADPDSGSNGVVNCETNSSHFELQPMGVQQYKVVLKSPLDRESQSSHDVSITCQDAGSPPLSVVRNFSVQVRDENDQVPRFLQTVYEAEVNESAAGSEARDVYVTSVMATDADVGENARLSYRVIDDPRNEFRVLDNGTVLALRGLDRETGGSPRSLRIIAYDHGATVNTATATLTLTVLDVNDNSPSFTDFSPLFDVSEGVPDASYVGNVSATDDDTDENAVVMFRLHPDQEGRVPFRVSAEGVIQTADILDREETDRYQLSIVAYDLGQPSLSSTANVTVRVTDVNDNCPVFLFPSDVNNSISIPHTLSPNTAVTSLRAYDVDAGRNRELVYSRDGMNGSRFFNVQPDTGEVILVEALSEKDIGDYVLTVVVHDLGMPTQLANQTLLYIHVYQGNQSAFTASSGETLRNALLVGVIVTVTVSLSVALVVAMVMLKRKDRERRLYRAKEMECKVDAHLRSAFPINPWHHELQQSPMASRPSGAPAASTSSAPPRRKEVSFSLDEDNNIASASATTTFRETSVTESLDAVADMTQSQKCLLGSKDDDASDVSCDVSTSDSGRGGSDVEMHSHHGAAKEMGGRAAAAHRGPGWRGAEPRRLGPLQHLRGNTFDPYPPTSSLSGTSTLTTFSPARCVSAEVNEAPRQNMTSFSSFNPIPRQMVSSRASPSVSSTSSLPPPRHLHTNVSRHRTDLERDPLPLNITSRPEAAGNYVDLAEEPRRHEHGDYMDMNGTTYVPASQLSVATSGTCDGETTLSGSYTVDPQELVEEIDKLFFDTPHDVVV